jgi:hypothetical protein
MSIETGSIIFKSKGRLGNGLFRYLACVIVHLKTNYEILCYNILTESDNIIDKKIVKIEPPPIINIKFKYDKIRKKKLYDLYKDKYETILDIKNKLNLSENNFIEIVNNNFNLDFLKNKNIIIHEYYQYDNIYIKYKDEIMNYIKNNKNDFISVDTLDDNKIYNAYDFVNYKSENCMYYDLVIHLRLEDFVQNNEYIKPEFLIKLFEKIDYSKYEKIAIVCNKITTDFEKNYIKILNDWFLNNNIEIVIESNSIYKDFELMKNCKTLICSLSTLSWMAAYFSTTITCCYFPDYNIRYDRPFQTFKNPIKNTVFYNIY